MVKPHSNYSLLALTGTTGTSSSLAYARTERSTVEVIVTTTGNTTVKVQGSTDASSPTNWSDLDSTVTATTNTYSVEINGAYNFIRATATVIASTGTNVVASVITQGAAC